MRTIFAVVALWGVGIPFTFVALLALIALGACDGHQGGYSPSNPPPMGMNPFHAPVYATTQPSPMQTYIMPSGRMMNCSTYGNITNCY